jgi:hypothetical protein
MSILNSGRNISAKYKQGGGDGINLLHGVYTGIVTNNSDSIYTGRVKVHIPELGNPTATYIVLLTTPFGGVTEVKSASSEETAYGLDRQSSGGTPKSYGMWPQPPAIGSEVLVAFTTKSEQGFLIGTVIPVDRNHMMGGRASSENYAQEGTLAPTGEKNPYDPNDPDRKPVDPVRLQQLFDQGLENDYARGHSASSARRESPSNVFGITTRSGHVVSLDDGDKDGLSNNIRIRSRGGAQILIDDTNGFIFVNNKAGSAWVELGDDGRIDVYSKTDMSIHTEGNFNVHSKGDINMQSDKGVNIRSTGGEGIKIDSTTANVDLYAGQNFKIEAALNGNVKAGGNYKETAGRIDMNGPVADAATRVLENQLVENKNILKSAASRVPEHHPWKGASKIQESFNTSKGNVT